MSRHRENFRADIAILRGIAVLLVLCSHFEIPGFDFGFIGVDIFFVISGYLITRILYKDYLKDFDENSKMPGNLSLSVFYFRRIRRLIPAAIVVIAVVNLLSLFLFNSNVHTSLERDSKFALFFLANVAFLRSGSDYFQENNSPSMLQHYWSLSVEEQFYFLWPILFLIAAHFHKFRINSRYIRFNIRILGLILFASIASFVFLQLNFNDRPLEAYFSLFTRAWELGVGAFFGVIAFRKRQETVFSTFEKYAPFAVTLFAMSIVVDSTNWAYWILFPVLATGFLLYAGENLPPTKVPKSRKLKFLVKASVGTGNISYSLYLVHWPIYVISNRLSLTGSIWERISLFPISFFFALLLWKYVEKPFQKISMPSFGNYDQKIFDFLRKRRFAIMVLAVTLTSSLFVVTYPRYTGNLLSNNSVLQGLNNDTNLSDFANLESSLANENQVSGTGDENGLFNEDSETVSFTNQNGVQLNYIKLFQQQKKLVGDSLVSNKLTPDQVQMFDSFAMDKSSFELSICGGTDSKIPPDCARMSSRKNAKTVLLLGDSKMGILAQPIIDFYVDKGWNVIPYVMFGCRPSAPLKSIMTNCASRTSWVMGELMKRGEVDLSIVSEYPAAPDSAGSNFIPTVIDHSRSVIIIQHIPKTKNPVDCIDKKFSYAPECSRINVNEEAAWRSYVNLVDSKISSEVRVIKAYDWHCISTSCPITVGNNYSTRDGSHWTYSFVKYLTPLIQSALQSNSNS